MNDLQIALIGLGAVLVAAVWAYNLWQSRKHRRQAETLFPQAQASDVLMAGREEVRSEPGMGGPAVPLEPTFAEEVVESTSEDDVSVTALAPLPAEWADGTVDCLLRVEFVDAVPVTSLWAELANWSGAVGKPLQWLGLDARSNRWRSLLPQDPGSVSQLAAALQLVDRGGPVSEAALGTFLGGVHQLAQKFSGLVELPEQAPVLAHARELDTFCAALDLQLSLHVIPRQGSLNELVGATLKPLLETAGLRLEGERFVATDADGVETFSLACASATAFSLARLEAMSLTALNLNLDVPRVADGMGSFERMLGFARQCADALGGQVVDAHQHPLSDATVTAIRARIENLQGQMAQAGFPAGSVRALRLFS
jgi:FtsZ-interacting cell division protein ZipA